MSSIVLGNAVSAGRAGRADRGAGRYATEEWLDHIGNETSTPRSTEEMLALWMPKLRPGAQRMLTTLIQAGGESLSYEDLAKQSGVEISGGSFSSYLSNLRTANLAEDAGRRQARANTEALFL